MDGLLVVDKPAGPTSHDVVARVRRAIRERRIGHTGTLDPAATGLLPLVLGRATRLARFLSASDKAYEAVIRLGIATDTRDAEGVQIGPTYQGPWPTREAVDRVLGEFRTTFLQQPPAYSAKKIDGQRSYVRARSRARGQIVEGSGAAIETTEADTLPAPARVTAHLLDVNGCEGPDVMLTIECSAGFYVRALAHDLGERLGTGAHLCALRRTRSGDITLDHAVALDTLERDPSLASRALIPLSRMLPGMPSALLTPDGVRHAAQGRNIGSMDLSAGGVSLDAPWIRLVGPAGDLVAIAEPSGVAGILHPSVVLV